MTPRDGQPSCLFRFRPCLWPIFSLIAHVWRGRSPSGLGGWLLTLPRIRVRGAGRSCGTFREGGFVPSLPAPNFILEVELRSSAFHRASFYLDAELWGEPSFSSSRTSFLFPTRPAVGELSAALVRTSSRGARLFSPKLRSAFSEHFVGGSFGGHSGA